MNKIKARVEEIKIVDEFTFITFKSKDIELKMISLDITSTIEVAKMALISIKATQIGIAKDFIGKISCDNQIRASIESIKIGSLFSSINLLIGDLILESIITTQAILEMNLKVGDSVVTLIKAFDISLVEVLDV